MCFCVGLVWLLVGLVWFCWFGCLLVGLLLMFVLGKAGKKRMQHICMQSLND